MPRASPNGVQLWHFVASVKFWWIWASSPTIGWKCLLEEQQQRPGELFGQIAIGMGLVNDEQLAQALAEQMGMQVVSLTTW